MQCKRRDLEPTSWQEPTYNISGSILQEVEHNVHVGVELANVLTWMYHLDKMTTKATGLLFFLTLPGQMQAGSDGTGLCLTLIRPNLQCFSLGAIQEISKTRGH